jgi:hypothetical protein
MLCGPCIECHRGAAGRPGGSAWKGELTGRAGESLLGGPAATGWVGRRTHLDDRRPGRWDCGPATAAAPPKAMQISDFMEGLFFVVR